jgi:hypothetical protein
LLRKYYKEGASVVTHFWVPTQKKIQKIKKYMFIRNPKMIAMRRGCPSAHKIVRNWLRRFKNTKFEI